MGKVPKLGAYDDRNLNQVWMIELIRERKLHELVHANSTLVLGSTLKACKLEFGNWAYGQHYVIRNGEQGGTEPNVFTIRDKDALNVYLYADRDGVIQMGEKK